VGGNFGEEGIGGVREVRAGVCGASERDVQEMQAGGVDPGVVREELGRYGVRGKRAVE
jgi:hypothetical protein